MSKEDLPTKFAQLIPEIYYDLIARIPAGIFFVLAIIGCGGLFLPGEIFDFRNLSGLDLAPTIILIILLFGAGYLVGIVTTFLGEFLLPFRSHNWKKICPDHNKEVGYFFGHIKESIDLPTKEGNLDYSQFKKSHYDKLDRRMHDFLKKIDIEGKTILPKTLAEVVLCNNLFWSFLLDKGSGLAISLIMLMINENLIIEGNISNAIHGLHEKPTNTG